MLASAARTAALSLLLGSAPAAAATFDFTSLHILGDSLSDTGNVWLATGGETPESPPYWRGRFSNGPVWADHVADAFEAEDLPTSNYAFGGAEADREEGFNPDLSFQRRLFERLEDDNLGARPLVVVQAGANDFKDTVGDRRAARRDGRATAGALGEVAEELVEAGIGDLMIFTLPNLGRVPKYARHEDPGAARSATAFTRAFNRRLAGEIAALRGDGTTVLTVDVHALFNTLLADPVSWGVRNARLPCIGDDGKLCTRGQERRRAFFDRSHPNEIVHRGLADAVLAELESTAPGIAAAPPRTGAHPVAPVPVPLPAALLLGGLLALGIAARRPRR